LSRRPGVPNRDPERSTNHGMALGTADSGSTPTKVGVDPEIALTADQVRLALVCLVDFEGAWDAVETATLLVEDGKAKAQLLYELRPMAHLLPALLDRGLDSLELISARYWFRHGRVEGAGMADGAAA